MMVKWLAALFDWPVYSSDEVAHILNMTKSYKGMIRVICRERDEARIEARRQKKEYKKLDRQWEYYHKQEMEKTRTNLVEIVKALHRNSMAKSQALEESKAETRELALELQKKDEELSKFRRLAGLSNWT